MACTLQTRERVLPQILAKQQGQLTQPEARHSVFIEVQDFPPTCCASPLSAAFSELNFPIFLPCQLLLGHQKMLDENATKHSLIHLAHEPCIAGVDEVDEPSVDINEQRAPSLRKDLT